MTTICSLASKHCIPCQGGIPPLEAKRAEELLAQLPGEWKINAVGHLYQRYTFDDFMGAMQLANQIAIIAEAEAHHPDLMISWGACTVEIWTHKIEGLTESDFILAAKIEEIA